MPSWASAFSIAKATRRCCSRRTKPTPSASSACRIARHYVKDGINKTSSRAEEAVNPEKRGTKAAAHYHLEMQPGQCTGGASPAERRGTGRAWTGPTAGSRLLWATHFDEVFCKRAATRRMSSMRTVIPRLARCRCGQCDASGAGRHAVEQAVLLLRRGPLAGGARQRPLQGNRKAGSAQ